MCECAYCGVYTSVIYAVSCLVEINKKFYQQNETLKTPVCKFNRYRYNTGLDKILLGTLGMVPWTDGLLHILIRQYSVQVHSYYLWSFYFTTLTYDLKNCNLKLLIHIKWTFYIFHNFFTTLWPIQCDQIGRFFENAWRQIFLKM